MRPLPGPFPPLWVGIGRLRQAGPVRPVPSGGPRQARPRPPVRPSVRPGRPGCPVGASVVDRRDAHRPGEREAAEVGGGARAGDSATRSGPRRGRCPLEAIPGRGRCVGPGSAAWAGCPSRRGSGGRGCGGWCVPDGRGRPRSAAGAGARWPTGVRVRVSRRGARAAASRCTAPGRRGDGLIAVMGGRHGLGVGELHGGWITAAPPGTAAVTAALALRPSAHRPRAALSSALAPPLHPSSR